MENADTNIRMPGILVPSYRKIISTEEGRTAMKRIRVECGVCRATRFYSIHRGITRIYGVVACEACRHFYQRFNRHPFTVQCAKEGRCFEQDDFLQKKCKACWVAQIVSHCPVNKSLFNKFSAFLPPDIKSELTGPPTSLEQLTAQERGGLGLEIYSNNDWVDVTEDKEENFTYTVDIDDGFEPDVGMDFEAEEEMIDDPGAVESSNIDEDPVDGPSTSTTITTRHRQHRSPAGVRQDMDPDDRVMALQLEGLHVNNQNKFMENFNPKTSERVRRKKKKVQYFSGTGRGKKEQVTVHDSEGRLTVSGQDLCDCLLSDCPGCHFPCPKCSSCKCGNDCRINRKWCYENVEVEGTKLKWRNEFLKK